MQTIEQWFKEVEDEAQRRFKITGLNVENFRQYHERGFTAFDAVMTYYSGTIRKQVIFNQQLQYSMRQRRE